MFLTLYDYTYEIIDHDKKFHEDQDCVKITSGDYEDVIYQYDVVEREKLKSKEK